MAEEALCGEVTPAVGQLAVLVRVALAAQARTANKSFSVATKFLVF